MPRPLTHRATDGKKRLTGTEKLLIHAERIGGNKTTRQIAKEYGVSNATVTACEHDERLKVKLLQADHIKKALSADLYITAKQSLDAITDERLLKVNAYQNAIITATLIDKALRIEEGAPQTGTTQIQISLQLNQLQEELKGLLNPT